ncbi:FtsW/RodA/SpoVE family cell cycle protein [candidate division WWE3 bacterium]|nr:FtsW/RodA/SpoVE family cell cycle protein [candidate division WWE3 bacterium]
MLKKYPTSINKRITTILHHKDTTRPHLTTSRHKVSSLSSKKIPDFTLLSLIFGFLIFGILMIFNTTGVFSQQSLGESYRLVLLQFSWILVGLIGFYFFYKVDYTKLRLISLPVFLISVVFLVLLAVVSLTSSCESSSVIFSPCINGAHRWFFLNPAPLPQIPFLGVIGFQPSEFAKFALILYLAVLLEKAIKQSGSAFTVFVVVAGLVSGLVMLQPNMSTAALLFLIAGAMYFVSGAPIAPILILTPIMSILGLGFMFSSAYRRARLLTFLSPGDGGDLSLGYHIKQIQIALGSGGLFGLGFGQSRQKFQYLPEVAADSIFAIIGEEFGFIGTTLFVLTFSFLIYKGYSVAEKSQDLFGRILATGITTWLAGQFFINIAAMTRIIPLTGVPLPLVSYGGSSTVFSLMALGLLVNISSQNKNY